MRYPHLLPAMAMVVLLLLPLLSSGPAARAAGPWTPVAAPPSTDTIVGAALLPDGQVYARMGQSAARYDPRADSWAVVARVLNPVGGQAMARRVQ